MTIIRRVAVVAAALAISHVAGTAAFAASSCTTRGGEGSGLVQSFAAFMAEAAMKNNAAAWGGGSVKIGKVSQSCKVAGLLYTCTARAKVCK